ncbi:hypothetical protein [Spongiimicrobium salis]|uniref:hypothetical protein n=1 Tax=Spongiimicrobium salis TaxID=1667022 RepID=UPI00374CADEA
MMRKIAIKKYLIPSVLLLLLGCGKDDDSILTIQLSYTDTEFVTDLRKEGSTGLPTINWQGNMGTFSLEKTITNVNINPDTGEVSWNRDLPIGTNEIIVLAKNETQETRTSFTITPQLGQSFWSGGHNNDPDSDVVFPDRFITLLPDGTVMVQLIDEPLVQGIGVWELEEDQITIEYCTSCPDANPFDVPNIDEHTLLRGTVTNSLLIANIEGLRFLKRTDPDVEQLRGYFQFQWD